MAFSSCAVSQTACSTTAVVAQQVLLPGSQMFTDMNIRESQFCLLPRQAKKLVTSYTMPLVRAQRKEPGTPVRFTNSTHRRFDIKCDVHCNSSSSSSSDAVAASESRAASSPSSSRLSSDPQIYSNVTILEGSWSNPAGQDHATRDRALVEEKKDPKIDISWPWEKIDSSSTRTTTRVEEEEAEALIPSYGGNSNLVEITKEKRKPMTTGRRDSQEEESSEVAAAAAAAAAAEGSGAWRKNPRSTDLAHRWREIQGCKKWEGLLEPALDAVLREEIMKYGEFAQATYDAFDNEKHSKYCGSSKYNKQKLLQEVGMGNFGYEVTKYLYAMANMDHIPKFFSRSKQADPWSKDSNWMGFVAVATDEAEIKRLGRRDIVISWRGTVTTLEWLANLHDYLTPLSPTHRSTEATSRGRSVNVESGFCNLYTSKKESTRYNKKSAAEQVKEEICRLVQLYADEELSITITGHSLGGALASLCAFDIVHSKCNERELTKTSQSEAAHQISLEKNNKKNEVINVLGSTIPVSVFTYASPRIGNDAFRDRLGELGVNILRVVNSHDIVPKVPGLLVNESMFDMFGTFERFVGPWLDRLPWTYTHAGVELKLDQTASPFVKRKRDYAASHNLDLYLHLLDGFHSRSRPFEPAVGRDTALVNRYSDSLNDDLVVPSSWWQQENKGLIQNEAGVWVQPERCEDDIPCPKAHERWL
ncbi:hypothetical protein CY35_01G079100 [Sphagnum magellanicum]|nr:hypothetical protein CY35_01G079100 [Sphagnum magellanicum]